MTQRHQQPFLGGQPLYDRNALPPGSIEICAPEIGYVDHIDTAALQKLAEQHGTDIYVLALPGTFIDTKRAVAATSGGDQNLHDKIAKAFSIDAERSFDQDPRFGLIVLAEIAQRALSPAVNDPGTAIDVIGRVVRVLSIWGERVDAEDVLFPNIHVSPIVAEELFDDFFLPVARDGAGLVEVQVRLQKALSALARLDAPHYREAAAKHAALALDRMRNAGGMEIDISRAEAFALALRPA